MAKSDGALMHDAGDQRVAEYRILSKWAVLGLVLGILSPLALFHGVIWIVPVTGVAVSLLAIWRISASPEDFTGSKVALLGLFLSVSMSAAVLVDSIGYRSALRSEANLVIRHFLGELASGNDLAAHQLTIYPPYRFVKGVGDLATLYEGNPDLSEKLEEWRTPSDPLEENPIPRLIELGEGAKIRSIKLTETQATPKGLSLGATVEIESPEKNFSIHFNMERLEIDDRAYWMVGTVFPSKE